MASVFEKIAAHDAAMSEVEVMVSIAPNPVVTVEPAAIKIALTVVQSASVSEIVAIKPVHLRLIVERAALRSLREVRGAGWAARRAAESRGARWATRHAAEVRRTGTLRHRRWAAAIATAAQTTAATAVIVRSIGAAGENEG
jgi:hypothetical protein